MNERMSFKAGAPEGYQALLELDNRISAGGLEAPLLYLVYLRASQLNGCAYCTDMHWTDARKAGVPDRKLVRTACWRESPGFTGREQAALAWTEAVTDLSHDHVSDAEFEAARQAFTETELCNLTLAIAAMNLWNRLGIAFRMVPGT
jgi:AhpD family alkylhydroperoxidase